ncbi:MAG: hypothetical protein II744_03870, partial [Eubacterium sp.]|nr:hypothetical protein [Eubacterium sp.]
RIQISTTGNDPLLNARIHFNWNVISESPFDDVREWDDAYYYQHPNFREGDKLTVFEGETSKVYTYRHDDNWHYFFENDNDPTDTIDTYTENGVRMEDHQNQTPWVLGNQNKFYVEYMGQSATLYATVKANPVKSITYTRADAIEYYEEDDGRFEDGVFIYYLKYARAGDQLTVTDTNDVSKTYTCTRNEENHEFEFVASDGSVIEENAVRFSHDQENTPWTVGSNNAYTVTYSGKSFTLYATVKKNPVASIVYSRSEPAVLYDSEGWNNGEGGLRFDEPEFLHGDTVTINYSDGTTPSKTFTFRHDDNIGRSVFIAQDGEVLDDVHTGSDQWDEPWTVGDNYYYVEYLGVRSTPIKVTIKKNTIKAIQVVKLNPVVLFEGDCHTEYSMMTGQPFDCYDIPWFEDGDKIIVTEDDDTTKEFVYTHNDEQDTSDFVCGNEVLEGSIYTYSNQAWKPWAVGEENSYFVSFRGLEYEIPVTIAASNIKSISFELAKPDELVFNEYEEGKGEWRYKNEGKWYFYAWFFADFRESTLTITYKDNSTSVYVVKFDSEDVGAYFENIADSNDKLYQSDVELYDRELEENWTPETRNVLYMKYKGAVCEIPVTINHVLTQKPIAPTCTAQGYTVDECSACHKQFNKRNLTNALGHNWDAGKVTKKATAKAAGIFEYTCTRCGSKKTESIKKSTFNVTAKKKSFKVKTTAKSTAFKAKNLYSVKNKNGKVSYKISKKVKGISVAKNGNITVKKGLTAGKTYSVKIKVTDAGNAKYAKVTKTVTIKIKT